MVNCSCQHNKTIGVPRGKFSYSLYQGYTKSVFQVFQENKIRLGVLNICWSLVCDSFYVKLMVHRILEAPIFLENLCIPVHIRLLPILLIIHNLYTATPRFLEPCSWEQGVMGKGECDFKGSETVYWAS